MLKQEIIIKFSNPTVNRPKLILEAMNEFNLKSSNLAEMLGVDISVIQEELILYSAFLPENDKRRVFRFLMRDRKLPIFCVKKKYDGAELNKLAIGFNREDIVLLTKLSEKSITRRLIEYAKETDYPCYFISEYCRRRTTIYFDLSLTYRKSIYDDKQFKKLYSLTGSEMEVIEEIISFLPEYEPAPIPAPKKHYVHKGGVHAKTPIKF